jgi:hypothetical protein
MSMRSANKERYAMRKWGKATFALSLIFATATHASVESSLQLFQTSCIGEKKTGFGQSDGGWYTKQLKAEKYAIEKLAIDGGANSRSRLCAAAQQDTLRYEDEDQIIDYGCYNVHEVDGQSTSAGSELCAEMWTKTAGKTLLDYVSCKAIRFKADGYFVATRWDASRLAGDKDLLEVTVGNCSVTD